jgi:iron(III) transport system substrate-binding protein
MIKETRHMLQRSALYRSALALVTAAMTIPAGLQPAAAVEEVNVYSYRQPTLIKPLFDAFTDSTGVKVNLVSGEKGLIERLQQEGANSPADLLITIDIGRLNDARLAGVTQAVKTDALLEGVAPQFRDPDGHWYGMTLRARLAYVSKDRVAAADAPKTYEELADPKWRGRICTRSGSHDYQVALTAAYIAHHGKAAAETWLQGLKANLARKPQGNDRAQVKAIKEGVCDVSLGNSYYYGLMLENPDQKPWADAVTPVFPAFTGHGTHVNLSGVSLTRAAPNRANAIKLMEYLISDEAQKLYAALNFEYPIVDGVDRAPFLVDMGTLKADDIPLSAIAEHRAEALKLIDTVAYNE